MISVIVPIYRVEEYLDRCVRSILNQTYKEFELVLVDDGSPDRCPEICDEWAKKDKRVKVIHKENGGLSDARNAGMRIASGEYIAFVDSDDWVSEFYLEKLIKAITESNCDIVECGVVKTKDVLEESITKYKDNVTVFRTEAALKWLIKDECFHQYVWNKLYKYSVAQDVFFEKGKTNEDEFWTYQVFGNAKTVGKIDIPLYYYYQRDTSIMGVGYSLKRLDALEAKIYRQKYIEEKYPKLKEIALINLLMSCVYQGQMSLLKLKGEQFYKAKEQINSIVRQIKPTKKSIKNLTGGTKFWILAAKISFWGTCRVRNMLKKGF